MTILDTLKSLLGLGSQDTRSENRGETGVTVEREPSSAPEPVSSPTESADDDGSAGATTEADDETVETEADATEAETGTAASEDESAGAAEDEPAAGTDEPTDVLEGIGPAYAERLSDAGVETVADLAAADLASLAEEADVPEGRLETWIDRAKNR